jgi:hypothetical protein
VNVPLGVLAIVAAVLILPPDEHEKSGALDLGGVVFTVVLLSLLIVPLLEGRELGWPAWSIISIVLSLVATPLFFLYERRVATRGGAPLVRVELFQNRGFATGVPIAGLFTASYAGFLLLLAVYLQIGLHFTPLAAGLTYTPSATGFFITSLLAPRVVPLLGRHVLTMGYITAAVADPLFHDILQHVTERRLRRTEQAPLEPGEFLAFQCGAGAEDTAWLHYLMREALGYGNAEVPHEQDRVPVLQAQVEEIRRRQGCWFTSDGPGPRPPASICVCASELPAHVPADHSDDNWHDAG